MYVLKIEPYVDLDSLKIGFGITHSVSWTLVVLPFTFNETVNKGESTLVHLAVNAFIQESCF